MNFAAVNIFQVLALYQLIRWLAHWRCQLGGILQINGHPPWWSRGRVGKGHPEMMEQASHLDISGTTVILTDILVMFLVLCTAQVMMNNKNKNQQLPTFCEQKEKLKKRLPWSKGYQFFCSVLALNNYLWSPTAVVLHQHYKFHLHIISLLRNTITRMNGIPCNDLKNHIMIAPTLMTQLITLHHCGPITTMSLGTIVIVTHLLHLATKSDHDRCLIRPEHPLTPALRQCTVIWQVQAVTTIHHQPHHVTGTTEHLVPVHFQALFPYHLPCQITCICILLFSL